MNLFLVTIFALAALQGTLTCEYFNGNGETCGPCNPTDLTSFPQPANFPNLQCVKGLWQCPAKSQIYDKVDKICRSPVAAPCNARNSCFPNTKCISGRCACKSGYREVPDGRCIKSIGDACTSSAECESDVPAPPAGGQGMTSGLFCDQVCKCPPGDIFRYNSTCQKAVGSLCRDDMECQNGNQELVCDRVEKKCRCPFLGDIYPITPFGNYVTCQTPVGARCGGMDAVYVDNAGCYMPPNYNNKVQCFAGFEPQVNGTCTPSMSMMLPPNQN